ncbi:hypothetical protein L1987_43719 [Smallanthus sonchifolius]|uniref:Uncharacterized protein n=1 Tax=Smallanthus sonchifolius TaxID=185202 RepID=A0ACB9GPG1_9ASTR|nr:hypothetical protein L1987_43719 [Smallanthus sonchifolius]
MLILFSWISEFPGDINIVIDAHDLLELGSTLEILKRFWFDSDTVSGEEQARLEAISRRKKGREILDELFNVLVEMQTWMQKHLVIFNAMEQKREVVKLLDLENYHLLFDEMIQRASKCVAMTGSDDNTQSMKNDLFSVAAEHGYFLSVSQSKAYAQLSWTVLQHEKLATLREKLHIGNEQLAKGSL